MASFLTGDMSLNQLDIDKELKKKAAATSMKKDAGGGDMGVGADVAGQVTTALTGSETAGSVMKAGMASGFNPIAMGAAAGIGLLSAAQKRRERKRQGRAKATQERARGMEKKAEIQGEMASAISSVLGGSGRMRGVNL